MIRGEHRVLQAFLGTLLTWGLTAAGSAVVFLFIVIKFNGRKLLDAAIGLAGGIMVAASFWSLLNPAIDAAKESGHYGSRGQYAFGPVLVGFLLGAGFVYGTELLLPCLTKRKPVLVLAQEHIAYKASTSTDVESKVELPQEQLDNANGETTPMNRDDSTNGFANSLENWEKWKRLMLLVISVTVHNIPEGLAIGVAFAAIGSTETATFESARNLALGIGIQNFPEGMAISVPLAAAGYSPVKSFLYGQLSGMVEPLFAILGAVLVQVATPILPYALSFGAGAMIYVVFDDLIPDASINGNTRIASWGAVVGFCIMMCLEVGLVF